MFAVIKTGGKQYKVSENSTMVVEKLSGSPGSTFIFNEVLQIDKLVGNPLVVGATVVTRIIRQMKSNKIIVFKKRRRKNYRRKRGHRQNVTLVKVTQVCLP